MLQTSTSVDVGTYAGLQNFTETKEITKVACPRSLWADKQKFLLIMPDVLGKHPPSKTDEFSEKFQTAFATPPIVKKPQCTKSLGPNQPPEF